MHGPYPVADLIERIAQLREVKFVGGTADWEQAIATQPSGLPAVFVLREERANGKAGGMAGNLIQEIGVTIKLPMWVNHAGGAAKLEAAMTDLERVLRAHLFGWRPSTQFQPLTITASGNDRAFGKGLVRQLLLTSGYRQTTTQEATS